MKIRKLSKQSGMTLTEILVVVAIIGILMVILSAGLGSVRAKAREKATVGLIHGLEAAIKMYKNHFNDFPPTSGSITLPSGEGPDYQNSAYLHYYLGSRLVVASGFDSNNKPTLEKPIEPLFPFRKTNLSTKDISVEAAREGKPAYVKKPGMVLDAFGKAIGYKTPGINHRSESWAGDPSGKRKGRDNTNIVDLWSRGLDMKEKTKDDITNWFMQYQ